MRGFSAPCRKYDVLQHDFYHVFETIFYKTSTTIANTTKNNLKKVQKNLECIANVIIFVL